MKKISILWVAIILACCALAFGGCSTTTPKNYDLHFESNGGTEIADISSDDLPTLSTFSNPTKEGFSFDGWYLDDGKWDQPITVSTIQENSESTDITIYAKWLEDNVELLQFSVVFQSNGGQLVSGTEIQAVAENTSATAPVYQKTGYSLSWDKDFSLITEDIIVNAVWTRNLTITFDGNGAESGSTLLQNVSTSITVNLNKNGYIRPGYMFLGWAKSQDSNIFEWADSATFTMEDSNVTLYAVWELSNYTIKSSPNGGNGTNFEENITFGAAINLPLNPYKKSENNFKCWDINGIFHDENAIFYMTYDTNIILNAVWEEATTNLEYEYLTESDSYTLLSMGSSTDLDIIVPKYYSDDVNGIKEVTTISDDCFSYADIKNITLPDSVTEIGDEVFYNCNALETINLPNSITSIGNYTFNNCYNLESIDLPDSITVISEYMFKGCSSLESIVLPPSVISIERCAFSNNDSLERIVIGKNVENISSVAIEDGNSLVNIEVSSENPYFSTINGCLCDKSGETLYRFAPGKEDVAVLSNMSFIEEYAFSNCQTLVSVVIPDNIQSIAHDVFSDCDNLINITISENVTQLSDQLFMNCKNLNMVHVSSQLTSIGQYTFNNCSLLGFAIPDTVVSIGESAFGSNNRLKNVFIPTSVTSMGAYVFDYNSYVKVYCFASENKQGWDTNWNYNVSTYFGYVEFAIIYNNNGGVGEMEDQIIGKSFTEKLNSNTFTKEGYAFAGWSTVIDGSIEYEDNDNFTMGTNDITLYARWTTLRKVIFDANGGVGEMDDQEIGQGLTEALVSNLFTKEGYTFAGWGRSFETTLIASTDMGLFSMGGNDETLYALWNGAYEVEFMPNGGTGTMENQEFITSETSNLNSNSYIAPEGQVFIGWSLSAIGSVQYIDESVFSIDTKNVVLYAIWKDARNIIFNPCGGAGTMENQIVPESTSTTLKANTYQKENYEFIGWSTTMNGLLEFTDNDSFTIESSDVNLYALWSGAYTITFMGNGGTSNMAVQTINTYQNEHLLTNTYIPPVSYSFAGWSTSFDGEIEFRDNDLFTMGTFDITFYAIWSTEHLVIYNANGGVGEMEDQYIGQELTKPLQANAFTAPTDKYFVGWAESSNGEIAYYNKQLFTMSDHDTNLYAIWKAASSDLEIVYWGGYTYQLVKCNNTTDDLIVIPSVYDDGINGVHNIVAINANAFKDCNTKVIIVPDNITHIYGNVFSACPNLEYVSLPQTLTIIENEAFNNCNALTEIIIPSSVVINNYRAIVNCPNLLTVYVEAETRLKFWEESWIIGESDIVWGYGTNTVFFNANGGTGLMENQKIYPNSTEILNVNSYVAPEGYTFGGWSTSPIGDAEYLNETDFTIGRSDVVLYAIWKELFTLSYDANGGMGIIEDAQIGAGMTFTSSANLFTPPTGLDFVGWGLLPDSLEIISAESAFVMASYDMTLYAIWEDNNYVTYNSNGGNGTMDMQKIMDEGENLLACDFTNDGYTFIGWSLSENGLIDYMSEEKVIIDTDIELFAKWMISSEGLSYEYSDVTSSYFIVDMGECEDTEIVIPSIYNDGINGQHKVTKINEYAFYNNSLITKVMISANIQTIEKHAFSGCTALTDATIPNGVLTIGSYAFNGCINLSNITIGENVSNIYSRAFTNCDSLISFTIPRSCTTVREALFSGCDNLETVIIHENVYSIATLSSVEGAFEGCLSLSNIVVSSNNPNYKSIDGDLYTKDGNKLLLYAKGKSATLVNLNSSVTCIGYNAFANSNNIISITMNTSLIEIGIYAFQGCENLQTVNFPSGLATLTTIGARAFIDCTSLNYINIPSSITKIDRDLFKSCRSLETIVIPNSVETIEAYVFQNCTSLTSIIIPSSVTFIGSWAFRNCGELLIKCEAESEPIDWRYNWNVDGYAVEWGYSAE